MLGVVSRDQALYLAFEKGYDLILLSENQNPPLAKLMDYGKHLYNQQKQTAKQKAHSHGGDLKEIRLGIKIGEHDLQVKINRIKKFLQEGNKVKVTVQLKGREMMFAQKVPDLLEKVRQMSESEFETAVERLGNRFSLNLIQSKKGKNETENR